MKTAQAAVRVVALAAAVGMVAAGLALRPEDAPGTDPDARPTAAATPGQTAPTPGALDAATCDATVDVACRAFRATAVAAADPTTLDLGGIFVGGAHVIADALASAERRGTRPVGEVTVVASSPMVLVGRADRMAALAGECGEPVDAACLAELVGGRWQDLGQDERWGRITLAVAPPASDPVTDLLLGAVVQAQVGSLDTAALRSADQVLAGLFEGTSVGADSTDNRLTRMVQTPALTDFRLGLLADWTQVADLQRAEGLAALSLAPAWAFQVAVWVPTGAAARDVGAVGVALRGQGWDGPDDHLPAPTEPAGIWQAIHTAYAARQ